MLHGRVHRQRMEDIVVQSGDVNNQNSNISNNNTHAGAFVCDADVRLAAATAGTFSCSSSSSVAQPLPHLGRNASVQPDGSRLHPGGARERRGRHAARGCGLG